MGRLSLDDRAALLANLTEELGAQVKTSAPGEGIKAAAFALHTSWSDGLTGEDWRAAAARSLSLELDGPVNLPRGGVVASDPPAAPPEPPAEPVHTPPHEPDHAEPQADPDQNPAPEPAEEDARKEERGHSRGPARGFGQARQRSRN
jgi:outer membrane biosynthesis protein TonB